MTNFTFATASTVSSSLPKMHTIFSTECNAYFDWQSLGLRYSHEKVKQLGPLTRLMACDKTPAPGTHIVPDTHVHPNYAIHPRTKDAYSPYNKPYSIMHWLQHAKPTADYIVVLDADMIFRKSITTAMLGVEKGRPISAHYGYLVGVFHENYMKVKERVANVDKAQQVGGFTVMHREDLERVAPLDGCIGPRRSDETHTVGPTQVTYSIRTGNLAHLGYPKCMDTSLRAQRLV